VALCPRVSLRARPSVQTVSALPQWGRRTEVADDSNSHQGLPVARSCSFKPPPGAPCLTSQGRVGGADRVSFERGRPVSRQVQEMKAGVPGSSTRAEATRSPAKGAWESQPSGARHPL